MDVDATAWLSWIVFGSYANARRLLRDDQDVNVRGADGRTALHVMAELGSLKKVQRLLADGADPRITDGDGRTPLCLAQFQEHIDVVWVLIECEEMVRALAQKLDREPTLEEIHEVLHKKTRRDFRENVTKSVQGRTTKFLQAAREGDLSTIQSMVSDGGLAVNAMDKRTGETAFSIALADGRRRMYEFLMKNDAVPCGWCVVDGHRVSVVSVAVDRGDVGLVRELVGRGARLFTPNADTRTCLLSEATAKRSSEMLETLVELGARFDWYDVEQQLPWRMRRSLEDAPLVPWQLLYCACWQQDKRRVAQYFATYQELHDQEMIARQGEEALFLAARQGSTQIAMDLLARGAPVTVRALYGAVANDDDSMLQAFLDHYGDTSSLVQERLNEYNPEEKSLLSIAVEIQAIECTKLLVHFETRDVQRNTALLLAVRGGDFELVRCLLDHVLPSTRLVLLECLRASQCPLCLDMLLTKVSSLPYFITSLANVFLDTSDTKGPELMSVLLAHGINAELHNDLATT